jgi:polysaccharide deacetylase family protein (PEP-CTERM system associated)
MLNALTIDVEEHFQVHAFTSVIRQAEWESHSSRVVPNTRRILQLLAALDVKATFFILGWVADRHPTLVQEIAAGGHEIGTHGYWHKLIYEQKPAEFAADLRESITAIQRACAGVTIMGYRAPAFSITTESLWALDLLRDENLRYDSSIFPIGFHDRYGIPGAERFSYRLPNGLWELPVSTLRMGRQNIPVAGGGYFRLYPLRVTRFAIRRLNQQQRPAVVYLHPWEFDPEQPRINGAPMLSRFRHYINLAQTYNRLNQLLRDFTFAPMQEVFAQQLDGSAVEPPTWNKQLVLSST